MFENIKGLKKRLKKWNREVFEWIDLKVHKDEGKINELDELLVDNFRGKINDLVNSRREASSKV